MKAQDTDGISRGQLHQGISIGEAMLKCGPLVQSTIQRHARLGD